MYKDILDRLMLPPKGVDEEDVSYDVEAPFTSIPIKDTINYILDRIYAKEKLKPLCKKLIFKRFLERLTSGCVFTANGKLVRQRDGCAMGGRFSMIMAGICMTKCINEVIKPMNLPFFKLYVDDGFARQKKDDSNVVMDALNAYHPKLNFTVENEPERFLDSKFIKDEESRTFSIRVFHKSNKFPTHWSSQCPRRYKRNALVCELHRAYVISDNFDEEVANIRERYLNAGFPLGFINETIKQFNFSRFEEIIPKNFFDKPVEKTEIRVSLPFCRRNEALVRTFTKKFNFFVGDSINLFIIWKTSKIRMLFPLKDKNTHPCCVIYEGTCSCGEKYTGETERCFHVRTSEHEDVRKSSEPSSHLKTHPGHSFSWKVICHAPFDTSKRKILEALLIAKFKPKINDQVKSAKLRLFPNGLT